MATATELPLPALPDPTIIAPTPSPSPTPSTRGRPPLLPRKSSGTMIVSRNAPPTEAELSYAAASERAMSPRRDMPEIEELSSQARRDLEEQARVLQRSLDGIVERVEVVKSEHEKLEGGNKFLQSYIGELMSTSKITSSAPGKGKGKGRSGK